DAFSIAPAIVQNARPACVPRTVRDLPAATPRVVAGGAHFAGRASAWIAGRAERTRALCVASRGFRPECPWGQAGSEGRSAARRARGGGWPDVGARAAGVPWSCRDGAARGAFSAEPGVLGGALRDVPASLRPKATRRSRT